MEILQRGQVASVAVYVPPILHRDSGPLKPGRLARRGQAWKKPLVATQSLACREERPFPQAASTYLIPVHQRCLQRAQSLLQVLVPDLQLFLLLEQGPDLPIPLDNRAV